FTYQTLPGLLSRAWNLSPGASCYRAELGRGPALTGSDEHAQTSVSEHGDRHSPRPHRGQDGAEAARRVARELDAQPSAARIRLPEGTARKVSASVRRACIPD